VEILKAGSAGDANELVCGGRRSVVDLVMVLPPATGRWERELKKERARHARYEQVFKLGIATVVALVVALVSVASFASLNGLLPGLILALCVVSVVTFGLAAGWSDSLRESVLIRDALSETAGNLVEVALAYDRDKRALRRRPSLCLAKVDALRRYQHSSGGLYSPPPITIIHPEVVWDVKRLLEVHGGIAGSDEPEDAEEAVKDFVEASLGLVLEAGRRHPVASSGALDLPGFEDLRWCLDHGARIAFSSSEADQHGADPGAERPPIVCWFDDGAPDEAMVLPQFEKFRAIAAPARNCPASGDTESA